MKALIREPLLHFLMLGAVLFGAYYALNKEEPASPASIVVTSAQIENLAVGFSKTWHRSPTQAELKELIDTQVKEEVLSREAVKLGLDQDDTVIRRRLQQKMEFIADGFVTAAEPTDAELADYLAKHPDDFRQDQRLTFKHVYLSREKHGDRLAAVATAVLETLKQNPAADIGEMGDRLMVAQEFTGEPQRNVASQFGPEFGAAVGKLKTGEWVGPIASGFGVHLVRVSQRADGRVPALADIKDQVRRELINARRVEGNQKFLDGLLAKYHVTVEPYVPDSTPRTGETAMRK